MPRAARTAVTPPADILGELADLAGTLHADLLRARPERALDGLVLRLRDGSDLEIRYPTREQYSFIWSGPRGLWRIDTAPRGRGGLPGRSHLHLPDGSVRPDPITSVPAGPGANLASVLAFTARGGLPDAAGAV